MGGGSASGATEVAVPVPSASSGAAEGDFVTAKTSVWWDIENCQVPRGSDAHVIAKNISTALANMGYKGMVSSISAYGDTNNISPTVRQALSSTGIRLNHVPAGVKDASDKKILVDMLLWAADNHPPANYLLISGDRDFSNALHMLRQRRYNILLAHAPNVSAALVAAAECVWQWTSLVNGGPPMNTEPPKTTESSGPYTNGFSDQRSKGKQSGKAATNMKYPNVGANESSNGFPGSFGGPPMNSEPPKTTESSGPYTNGFSDQRTKGKQSGKAATNMKYPNVEANESSNGFPGSFGLNSTPMIHQANRLSSPQKSFENSDSSYMGKSFGYSLPPNSNGSSVGSNMVKEAPHEFFVANTSGGSNHQSNSLPSSTAPNLHPSSHQVHPLLRPSDLPHEFFGANMSGGSNHQSNLRRSSMAPNLHPSSHQVHPLLRPSDLLSSKSMMPSGIMPMSNAYKRTPFPQPPVHDGSSSAAFANANLPDMNRLSISNHSHGVNYNTGPYQQNLLPPNNVPPFAPRPELRPTPREFRPSTTAVFAQSAVEVQYSVGTILRALHALKIDKMTPTESNIADCIHYGMNLPNFNVKLGLDHAIRNNCVLKHGIGASLPLYVGKQDNLWKCVNVVDLNAKHPKTTWDAVQSFISSSSGRSALLGTQCRYQAALLLKTSCLKDASTGDALQILNLVIKNKKWIVPHLSGWQPLAIKLSLAA